MNTKTQIVVLGSGPGGYAAAFHAADLGFSVTLVEKYETLGGVCLNVGCIPSKALLHLSALKDEIEEVGEHGLSYGSPKVDINKMRAFKESVVGKLTGGLKQLSKARKVNIIHGEGKFTSSHTLEVKTSKAIEIVTFEKAIIATGSQAIIPKPWDIDRQRVMTSTGALALRDFPKELLVIGGGVIGLEMGFVYSSYGTNVTVIEALPHIANGADREIVKPLEKKLKKKFKDILVNTKVNTLKKVGEKVEVEYTKSDSKVEKKKFDRVLVSVGRSPNSANIGLENTEIKVNDRGFIEVDHQMKTSVPHIFAIGDVVGNPMLAHKASAEARVAVSTIKGDKASFDFKGIPSVIYTVPEVAWVGLTEEEAKDQKLDYKVGKFPWAASGRAISMSATDGITKILFDSKTERILGMSVCGLNAGELIIEGGLAIEMGAVMEDIAGVIHAHPTLSETTLEAAEDLHGMGVHVYSPKKK